MEKNDSGPAYPVLLEGRSGTAEGMTYHDYRMLYGMTLRQYAAIALRVPDSGEEWLDAMIRKSLRNEFADRAAQSIIVNAARFVTSIKPGLYSDSEIDEGICQKALELADIMLKKSEES